MVVVFRIQTESGIGPYRAVPCLGDREYTVMYSWPFPDSRVENPTLRNFWVSKKYSQRMQYKFGFSHKNQLINWFPPKDKGLMRLLHVWDCGLYVFHCDIETVVCGKHQCIFLDESAEYVDSIELLDSQAVLAFVNRHSS